MRAISIYKYGNTLTPIKRGDNDTPAYTRIIADSGHALVKGDKKIHSLDIEIGGEKDWEEIEDPVKAEPTLEELEARIAAIETEQVKQNADIEATAAGLTDTITQIMGGAE